MLRTECSTVVEALAKIFHVLRVSLCSLKEHEVAKRDRHMPNGSFGDGFFPVAYIFHKFFNRIADANSFGAR